MTEESPTGALDAAYRRLYRRFREIGPSEARYETFLTEIHGAGWKERALAAGPPEAALGYARRLRELEDRLARVEARLNAETG